MPEPDEDEDDEDFADIEGLSDLLEKLDPKKRVLKNTST